MPKAVFLDRDGVINVPTVRDGKSYPPDHLKDFKLLPGVKNACIRLKKEGFCLVVVTNQPDVATGKQKREVVEAMHEKLMSLLPLDDIRVCYHIKEDRCKCRKPKPGMILAAATKHQLDLSKSFIVGDRWRDIEAGQNAGCFPFFIDYGLKEKKPSGIFMVTTSLEDAAEMIVSRSFKNELKKENAL